MHEPYAREAERTRVSPAETVLEARRVKDEFFREKAEHRVKTPYGLYYSPHYLRQSRSNRSG